MHFAKLKEFADDNFKWDEWQKFYKRVENALEKGEIARYDCQPVCELSCLDKPRFLRVCSTSLFKTLGKGEIALNEQFLLFPQCFLPFWRTFCHFHQIWNCRLQTLSVWKYLKFVVWERVNSVPNNKFLDSSKFDENCRKFWRWVENTVGKGEIAHYEQTVGKGEIAHYEQFLLFPLCFQKTCTGDIYKPGFVWESFNPLPDDKF